MFDGTATWPKFTWNKGIGQFNYENQPIKLVYEIIKDFGRTFNLGHRRTQIRR